MSLAGRQSARAHRWKRGLALSDRADVSVFFTLPRSACPLFQQPTTRLAPERRMQRLDLTLDSPAENLALDEALLLAAESGEIRSEVLRIWEPRVHGRAGLFLADRRRSA